MTVYDIFNYDNDYMTIYDNDNDRDYDFDHR